MTVATICICGAGTMGSGIAQVAATAGYHVLIFDVVPESLQRSKQLIESQLDQLVLKNKLQAEEARAILLRIRWVNEINDCIADLIIEAVVEKEAIKVALFNQLAEVNHSETIFATNTSSLSITSIAEKVMHSSRVIGMHFFNPAPLMKLVEVVSTPFTLPEVTETIEAIAKQMGKVTVRCTDSPGFIVNHVARPYYLEALRLLESGLAAPEDIDRILEASGFRMGPFKLMDLIGNDINYAVSCSVYEQLGQPERLKPSAIQEEKVRTGKLGRKSGEGYYQYQ